MNREINRTHFPSMSLSLSSQGARHIMVFLKDLCNMHGVLKIQLGIIENLPKIHGRVLNRDCYSNKC